MNSIIIQSEVIEKLADCVVDAVQNKIDWSSIDWQAVAEKATSDRPTGKWVSVKDRLPEDRRIVLVTAYWNETYQVMEASYFGDGVWWCVPFNNCGDHMQQLKPKAWMELPEPYKEAENE